MAGTTYIRQSTFADGDTITAALFNNEFNQLVNAFAYTTSGTTGHTHDGTSGQGGHISKIGDQDFKNKIEINTANNRIGFFSKVGGVTTEQLRIQDGAVVPVVDSDIDLGSSSLYFKNTYTDSITTTGNATVGGVLSAASFTLGGSTVTATAAELNVLDGITATTAELNYTDGVTSNIQTQLATKQPLDAQLTDIAGLTPTDGSFIVGNGTNFVTEAPATALASLGVTSTATELNVLDGITATTAELNYVHNVTSAIQTQLDNKQPLDSNLTDIANLTLADNFFVVSTGSNLVLESPATALGSLGITATAAELNYVDGVTSAIQTQLNTKAPLASPTFTGTLTAPIINASSTLKIGGNTIGATATEINYLSGVTSSIQNQLDALQDSDTDLTAIAALTPSDGNFIVGNGTTWVAESGNTVLASVGVTATATELNFTDGVTSNIQTQLDAKEPADSTILKDADIGSSVQAYDSNLTSFVTALDLPTTDGAAGQALITDGAGTVAFGDVDALPTQTGNSGYFLTTDGTDPSWAEVDALPTQTGNSGKYLTTDGTDASWAVIDIPAYAYTRTNFTATASQTTFTVAYTVGYVEVYLNGIKLIVGTDVTATNGTSVVLATGAASGDLVEVIAFTTFEVADALTSSDLGASVQAYDADTAKYDDATANFTGTLQNGGSNVVVDSDIGSTVQAYDATIVVDADIGVTVQGYDANTTTSTNTQTLTNKTIRDTVYALSGTAFDAINGAVQTKTLAANTTFTDSLSSGDAIVLQLEGGASYTVTWPTMTWVTSGGNVSPTLTAKDTLVFWKVSSTLYGAYVGSYV